MECPILQGGSLWLIPGCKSRSRCVEEGVGDGGIAVPAALETGEAGAEVISPVRARVVTVFARSVGLKSRIRPASGVLTWSVPSADPKWFVNEGNMKVCFSIGSPIISAELDPRFGRAAYFLIYDPDLGEQQIIVNPALEAAGGAGIQAAQFVVSRGCGAVVSGDFGPNAYEALEAAGVKMYLSGNCNTVPEALNGLASGRLELLAAPTVAGHRHH